MRSEIAFSSSSVKLFSAGCSTTSTASDLAPSGTPAPVKTSNKVAPAIAVLSAPRTARSRRSASSSAGHQEGEVAADRLQSGRREGGAHAARAAARGQSVEVELRRRRRAVEVEGAQGARVQLAELGQHRFAQVSRPERPG
jgi:hypothetical protein